MSDEPTPCSQCGAGGLFGTCSELFDRLLALDHQRLLPWGRFHGLNLVCFLLQHPDPDATAETGGQWQLVSTFLSGGMDALHLLESSRVEGGRRGHKPWIGLEPAPPRSTAPSVTIEDVSVDGSFPAVGYEDRMLDWATSIARERAPDDARTAFRGRGHRRPAGS